MRVIRSTTQSTDIDPDLEDDYAEAAEKALTEKAQVRETYRLNPDASDQKDYQVALVPYTDPTGAHRWAVLNTGHTDLHWQDSDDLAEANAAYESEVRNLTACALPDHDDKGNELPIWDETDVPNISAATVEDGKASFRNALLVDAVRIHEAFAADEKRHTELMQRRQLAFARFSNAYGRGSQAVLSVRAALAPPTVKRVVDSGRRALDAIEMDECTCVEFCDEDPKTACGLSGTPHVHPEDPNHPGAYGPCPSHPDRPGDR